MAPPFIQPPAEIFPVLKGKVAIITGASQGMGKATAEVFLKAGAKVVMADIKEKEGQEVAKELSAFGEVLFVKADISKSDEVQALIHQTVAKFGKLDAAINNAALTPDGTPLHDFDEDYWNRNIGINLTGTALCCKYEMKQMMKQGSKGTIVNIGSINSFRPQPNMPAYTCAKHAIIGLTKTAATEGGPHGIRVNTICPGPIYSEMSVAALVTMGIPQENFIAQGTVLHRWGQAHEVAQGSLWLSSDSSSFVTGVALPIDGGIGASTVRNLASKGCNIIINHATASSDESAAQLSKELEKEHGVKTAWVRADISKREESNKIIETAKKHFANPKTGKLQIDIIVHNAAIVVTGPLEDTKEDDFKRIYDINVLGPILLTGACKPYLPTDRSGRIVMISSINPTIGTQYTTLYSGTKAALEAMARVWARELAENATVNTINPGPVMTDMYLSSPDEVKAFLAPWNKITPLVAVRDSDSPQAKELGERFGGRAAYDYEIAGLVGMLCSPESGWCTGSMISANGGLTFSS
ncbi:hypothetical protein M426DRAFT_74552 [Hypoxylon sp. CI-4A]|nr:hypothetical protein M426DRAFT_74552 [Hypoxylon sp. CI-4A]